MSAACANRRLAAAMVFRLLACVERDRVAGACHPDPTLVAQLSCPAPCQVAAAEDHKPRYGQQKDCGP